MIHYTIGRDPKIDPPCHGKSITYRIATPANCSSWVKAAVWRKFVRSPAMAVVMVAWLVNKTIIKKRA